MAALKGLQGVFFSDRPDQRARVVVARASSTGWHPQPNVRTVQRVYLPGRQNMNLDDNKSNYKFNRVLLYKCRIE